MLNFLLSKKKYTAAGSFKIIPLVVVLFLFPDMALSKLKIDGQLDEPEWKTAQVFQDFVEIDPLTFGTPRLPTEARLLSTPEGLAVAFICHQPSDETRTRTITQQDAEDFDADAVSFMVDFDDTGATAYEFSVSITGSYRDGTITNENSFNYDWDAVWERGVYEASEFWSVEMLIPWSIVAMKEGSGKTRRIAVFFKREVNASGEAYGFPRTSSSLPRFVSDFAGIEVRRYSAQEFDVWPYVTVLSDFVEDNITSKAGLDLFWKPSGAFQVAATFNPDFGQVESDDLVINFTTTETVYSDKRPFFTENQSIFSSRLSKEDCLFYTRRIGAGSDKDGSPSDIDGAVKAIGSVGSLNYGMFAAQEEGDAGKEFYAGRIIYPGKTWSVGVLSTYTKRPFLDRTALVNGIDYDIRLGQSWRYFGQLVGSMVDQDTDSRDGFGIHNSLEFTPNDRWTWVADMTRYSADLDLNDMGYIHRNDYEELSPTVTYYQTGFADNSRIASVTWVARGKVQRNITEDVWLRDFFSLSRVQKMRNGDELSLTVSDSPAGYHDTISRGNGLVYLNGDWKINLSYNTPKRRAWRQSISLNVFQEGLEDWAVGFEGDMTWYPHENLNLDFRLSPTWSRDWLIWLQDDLFASYARREISGEVTANWFPAESHEIRLKAQWLTIDADAEQSYRIGPRNRLVESEDSVGDFAMIDFGFQLRYRYEIAPLSDLYVVYSRGGLDRIDNPSRSTLGLFADSMSLRDSDQFLVKLRYRF